ncbi:hypothetical protein [Allosalinactinospora lopnorensis]|uniref:hypothetical protein n=1 Tax=Allosalinactinospora lopnorensis TaxID=1352348 RepID=UPI00191BDD4E|nr:hypothetical protein [Allosalinactinospora lopnorensis]
MGNAIAALVASIVTLCLCWIFALPALVLSIIGMVLANDNSSASRGCTLAAWALLAVGLVLGVAYFALHGAVLFSDAFGVTLPGPPR